MPSYRGGMLSTAQSHHLTLYGKGNPCSLDEGFQVALNPGLELVLALPLTTSNDSYIVRRLRAEDDHGKGPAAARAGEAEWTKVRYLIGTKFSHCR